ncbi:glycosyltransferase involved in cell wall biosynthesis [Desulfobaculum xiamenense]|uniref:Glycosyltransferase involved in cell wall biosynthesis n=1 Tax=Desulfobaculum xiamenense TaxID=995050 RepID=A0A846QUV8_9BACT|nr:glycosyltransferase family 2 protein [Desulfobaculum xiamenense]NJB68429.1 glycosyltransferase involved in cell wall biosynthesis [Desulfobaculum xiamenense]
MSERVTAVILTFNGQKWLEKTLASLGFCDRILVVDSGSTDATLEIARAAGADVLHRAWEGTIPQFRFAFEHVDTPWIITLDQDEFLSPELRASVTAALAAPGDAAGFMCPRRSWYLDRFVRHSGWYPDRLLRVFRLDGVEIRGMLPHEEFHPTGPTRDLDGDIIHYPYADLAEHLDKINSYTSLAAREMKARGRRAGVGTALAHAFGKFLKQYVLKQGFRDGRAGLVLAVHAFVYAFHKYMKLVELCDEGTSTPDIPRK